MAQVKLRTTVEEVEESKSSDMLIFSWATHQLLRDHFLFQNFEKLEPRDVPSALGMSEIVGKGQVLVPMGTGFLVDAPFTLNF